MKVGDLVCVAQGGEKRDLVGIIAEIYLPNYNYARNNREAIGMARILQDNKSAWYPLGCIEVISESKQNNSVL